jgi:hypothetical protein
VAEVDGLNAGYARVLLEEYLENPEGVPSEWRALFESGNSDLLTQHPGVARLVELLQAAENGDVAPVVEAPPIPKAPTPAPPADDELVGAVAAAMALIKAHRTHGHLAAHLDPLGSEPVGDPALEPERLVPPLTPELQEQVPARLLRVYFPGETLADVLPKLQQTYSGTSAYEIEHISDHQERVWLRQAIESGKYRTPLSADEKRRLLARLTAFLDSPCYRKTIPLRWSTRGRPWTFPSPWRTRKRRPSHFVASGMRNSRLGVTRQLPRHSSARETWRWRSTIPIRSKLRPAWREWRWRKATWRGLCWRCRACWHTWPAVAHSRVRRHLGSSC